MASLTDKLTAIADAIREVEGTEDTFTLDEMAEHVGELVNGEGALFIYAKSAITTTYSSSSSSSSYYQDTDWYGADGPFDLYSGNATKVGAYAFYNCTKALESIDLPACTSIGTYAFRNCSVLASVDLPVCASIGSSALSGCTALTSVDLPVCTSIGSSAFENDTALGALTLRADEVCTLSDRQAFQATPIEDGDGYIYVPADLVEEYQSATNWATYADQIKAIEE